MNPNDRQIGGSHYSAKVQHWDICGEFDIPYLIGCMTKYLYRYPAKNGMEDIGKAIHYADKWIEIFYNSGRIPARMSQNETYYLKLNESLLEFSKGIHEDVDSRVREMIVYSLFNWGYMSREQFVSYRNMLQEILDASNN